MGGASSTNPALALREFITQLGIISYGRAVDSCDIDNYGGEDGETDTEDAAGELDDLANDYWDHIDRWTLASLFCSLPKAVQDEESVLKVMREAWDIYLQAVMARPDYASIRVADFGIVIDGTTFNAPENSKAEDLKRLQAAGLLT